MTPDERVKAAAEAIRDRRYWSALFFPEVERMVAEVIAAYDATRPPLDPATVEACAAVCLARAEKLRAWSEQATDTRNFDIARKHTFGAMEASFCASAIRALATTSGEDRS